MEKVSWKRSKAYHTISFSFSPEGRFLILDWKTGSREAWRKPCGCHLERVAWAGLLTLPRSPAHHHHHHQPPQPQLCNLLCPAHSCKATKRVLSCCGSETPRQKIFPCLHHLCLWGTCWRTSPWFLHGEDVGSPAFPHLSYCGLQLPLTGDTPILHSRSSQFTISNLAHADNHLFLPL